MATTYCPRCDTRWKSGANHGHCGACHQTFKGESAFDRHRVGEHGTPSRRCEIQPYEVIGDDGKTRYGHWIDGDGVYRFGRQLTKEERAKLFDGRS